MRFLLMTCLLAMLPSMAVAAEPAKNTRSLSVIDMTLPIHQQKKLHPELSDPVLGDQAQIVEWAWSPQYAKRFELPVQPNGLKDGVLWLIGVKVQRIQNQQWQRYTCNIIGVMRNDLPILTPPGEQYLVHPDYGWFVGGLPGKHTGGPKFETYTPGQAAWYKQPKNKLEEKRPERSITMNYIFFTRHFQNDLAFFEVEGGCGYFNDPENFRNEISFPGLAGDKGDENHFSPYLGQSATKFVLSNSMMQKIYPYIREAEDWTSCMLHRSKTGALLTTRSLKSKRFGNTCNPPVESQAH